MSCLAISLPMLQETEKHHTSGRASCGPHSCIENRGLEPISAEKIAKTSTHRKRCFFQYPIYFPVTVIFFLPWYSQQLSLGTCVKWLCFQLMMNLIRRSFKAQPNLCYARACTLPYTSKALCEARCSHWPVFPYPPHSSCPSKAHAANLDYGIFILFLLRGF